jgi:hypothetical protein
LRSSTSTTTGSATFVIRATGPWFAPIGSARRSSDPTRQVISIPMTQRRADRLRHSTPTASRQVKSANNRDARPNPSMNTSPASAKGNADKPAIVQNIVCIKSRTNTDSGRLEILGAIN